MEITEESGSALAGHPLSADERVIGHFLITITGSPKHGNDADVMADAKSLIIKSILDNKNEFGEMVASLHVVTEEFDPEVFFG